MLLTLLRRRKNSGLASDFDMVLKSIKNLFISRSRDNSSGSKKYFAKLINSSMMEDFVFGCGFGFCNGCVLNKLANVTPGRVLDEFNTLLTLPCAVDLILRNLFICSLLLFK